MVIISAWLFYDISVRVQPAIGRLARGVGTPELLGASLAALLPAVCVPAFDAREKAATLTARITHTFISATFLIAPLLVIHAWYQSVRFHVPSQTLPPAWDLAGNVLLAGSIGVVSTLIVGPRVGPLVTLLAYSGFVVAQQAWPESVLTKHFSTGKDWTTNWWLTAGICVCAIALDYLLCSVPWRRARHDE
ncbi:hypothetical protein EF847_14735 [Actinobacteria bacterium YIM 96077]|uniref:Uncharacterized protein n=1 Tax=Phytoactinopolyspora halophila TaxID=1981511 RepID=A0A329QTN4_9ACTN|nr:hypothetical protein EF847_14735 [Actinobacteria bacterium YIM 96077]RAW15695.1 hypothetical protein DPM12_08605 [Phytoactinopolyspora halophila]